MSSTMSVPSGSNAPAGSSLRTRASLIRRLQAGDDHQGWQEFYAAYGGLIRTFALRAGLTADEAEEVVQETAIGVARGLPEFVYDPKVCRFRTWLLNQTRWRIQNQFRRRPKFNVGGGGTMPVPNASAGAGRTGDDSATGDELAQLPDPVMPEFGAEWDAAWEKNLVARALEQVSERIGERQLQVFDMHVTQGWSARDVARTFGISVARVYLTKHRVGAMLRKEVRRLEKNAEQGLTGQA
jgi:RNA polymerase sigma-70 factor (ECF subfamily)